MGATGEPKEGGARAYAFNLHQSVGITLFALMVLRVIWRTAAPPPPLPPMPPMPLWQSRLAHFNHHQREWRFCDGIFVDFVLSDEPDVGHPTELARRHFLSGAEHDRRILARGGGSLA